MTSDQLCQLLGTLPPYAPWPDPLAPEALLRALEAVADRHPADQHVARAIGAVHGAARAGRGLPPVVAGVRREALVRWDAISTTWEGVVIASGSPALVRVLRPHAAGDGVHLRGLVRTGRALAAVMDGVCATPQPHPALVAEVQGLPWATRDGPAHREDVPRLLMTGLHAVARWEAAGLGLPPLAAAELRHGPDGLALAVLSPCPPGDHTALIGQLASALRLSRTETSVTEVVSGLAAHPPSTATEALTHVVAALAQDLAARRHALHRRHVARHARDRSARLEAVVRRLARAVDPPVGRGAVGVDLEGRITVVEYRDGALWWGPEGEPAPVWTPEAGFDAARGRRLLRARAVKMSSARLQDAVGGDPLYVERVGRWIAAGLRLRTVRLLLERAG